MQAGARGFAMMKYRHLTSASRLWKMTQPTADLFESLVDQSIVVTTATGLESWRVTHVQRHAAHALRNDQPFTVTLLAPAENDRQQGMRACTLPGGQAIDLFAVPIAATKDSVSYELVFN